jgi:hypothetical protein
VAEGVDDDDDDADEDELDSRDVIPAISTFDGADCVDSSIASLDALSVMLVVFELPTSAGPSAGCNRGCDGACDFGSEALSAEASSGRRAALLGTLDAAFSTTALAPNLVSKISSSCDALVHSFSCRCAYA